MSFEDIFANNGAASGPAEFDIFDFVNDESAQVDNGSDIFADYFTQGDASGSQTNEAPIASARHSPAPSSESETSQLPTLDLANDDMDATFGLNMGLLTGAPPAYDYNSGVGSTDMSALFSNVNNNFGQELQQQQQQQQFEVDWNAMLGNQPQQNIPTQPAPAALPMFVSPNCLSLASLQSTPDSFSADLPQMGQPMKRKLSEDSASSEPKKKRGRPCKNPSADGVQASPLPIKGKRQASKPTVAKPKAIVPQKYFTDGSAQNALGMTEEQIKAFPDFDTLLLAIPADRKTRAIEFGDFIERGRKLAAESAQQNRAAKEERMNRLAEQVNKLRAGYQSLLNAGQISLEQFEQFTAE